MSGGVSQLARAWETEAGVENWIDLPGDSGHREKSRPWISLVAEPEADVPRFAPVITSGKSGRVSIWLPELAVYGEADSIDAASWALVDEVIEYVAEWWAELGSAPNHAVRADFVLAIGRAGDREAVHKLLFRP